MRWRRWWHRWRRRLRYGRAQPTATAVRVNPFELYLVCLVLLGGLPLLVGAPAPRSLDALVARFWQLLWGAELVVGAAAKLVGIFGHRVRWRIAGLWLLGYSSVAYALAIITTLTPGSGAAVGYIGGFAVACFAQIRFLRRAAKAATRRSSEPPHA